MNRLDDQALLALDASGMLGHIANVGSELKRAWRASETLVLPASARHLTSIVLAGMGGSATAGDYFAALCARSATVPVSSCRGYALPHYVSGRTLVIVSSYSGETAEALSLYEDARKRGAALFCITSGGSLGVRAATDGVSVHKVAYEGKPRTALAHGLAPLLRMGSQLGLLTIDDAMVEGAASVHTSLARQQFAPSIPFHDNGAKKVATALVGRTPFVVGSDEMAVVATRFRNQLAENGKVLAAADSFPEAGHNLIVGLGTGEQVAARLALVVIESRARSDPRIGSKLDAFVAQFQALGIPVARLDAASKSLLEELLIGTAWGDYVSFYLALLNGLDPTPIPQIDQLKLAADGSS